MKERKYFRGGPLDGKEYFCDPEDDVYVVFDEDGAMNVYIADEDMDSMVYAGVQNQKAHRMRMDFRTPPPAPAAPEKLRKLRIRRTLATSFRNGKVRATTLNGREVAHRYMQVIKKLRDRLFRARTRRNHYQREYLRAQEDIDVLKDQVCDLEGKVQNTDEQLEEAYGFLVRRICDVMIDMEIVMEDSVPGFKVVFESPEAVAEFIDSEEDYETFRAQLLEGRRIVSTRKQHTKRIDEYKDYEEEYRKYVVTCKDRGQTQSILNFREWYADHAVAGPRKWSWSRFDRSG